MAAIPSVDVAIVSWNVRQELLDCLGSVLASTGVDPRVVVVDNASSDGSAEAVAAEYPRVHLVKSDVNLGFARGTNIAAARGSAPHLLLLNPDTEVPKNALAELVRHLDSLPHHAAIAPRLVSADGQPQHSVFGFPSIGLAFLVGSGAQRWLPHKVRRRLLLVGSWDSDIERDVPWAIGAALLMRRSDWERIGPLDESFFVYAEDLDWCDRARRMGSRIRFLPSVEVVHHGNRSGAVGFGNRVLTEQLANSLVLLASRRGRLWAWVFAAMNASTTGIRYALRRVMMAAHVGRQDGASLAQLRAYAGFYAGWLTGRWRAQPGRPYTDSDA